MDYFTNSMEPKVQSPLQRMAPRLPKSPRPINFEALDAVEANRLRQRPSAEQMTYIEALTANVNELLAARVVAMKEATKITTDDRFAERPKDLSKAAMQAAVEHAALKGVVPPATPRQQSMRDLVERAPAEDDQKLDPLEAERWARGEALLSAFLKHTSNVPTVPPVPKTPRPEVREWQQADRIDRMLHRVCKRDIDVSGLPLPLQRSAAQCQEAHEMCQQLVAIQTLMETRRSLTRTLQACPHSPPPHSALASRSTERAQSARPSRVAHTGLPTRPGTARR